MATIAQIRREFPEAQGMNDDEIIARVADITGLPLTEVASRLDAKLTGPYKSSAISGMSGFKGLMGEAASFGAGAVGLPTEGIDQWAAQQKADSALYGRLAGEQGVPQSITDVDSLGSFGRYATGLALENVPNFIVGGGGGGGLGRMATGAILSRVPMSAAQAATASRIASGAGVAASTYPTAVGDIMSTQRESGDVNRFAAGALAVPYAVAEAFSPVEGGIARLIGGGVRGNTGNYFARLGKELLKSPPSEAAVEGTQQFFNEFGRSVVDPTHDVFGPEARRNYLESAAGGATLGMGGSVLSAVPRTPDPAKPTDLLTGQNVATPTPPPATPVEPMGADRALPAPTPPGPLATPMPGPAVGPVVTAPPTPDLSQQTQEARTLEDARLNMYGAPSASGPMTRSAKLVALNQAVREVDMQLPQGEKNSPAQLVALTQLSEERLPAAIFDLWRKTEGKDNKLYLNSVLDAWHRALTGTGAADVAYQLKQQEKQAKVQEKAQAKQAKEAANFQLKSPTKQGLSKLQRVTSPQQVAGPAVQGATPGQYDMFDAQGRPTYAAEQGVVVPVAERLRQAREKWTAELTKGDIILTGEKGSVYDYDSKTQSTSRTRAGGTPLDRNAARFMTPKVAAQTLADRNTLRDAYPKGRIEGKRLVVEYTNDAGQQVARKTYPVQSAPSVGTQPVEIASDGNVHIGHALTAVKPKVEKPAPAPAPAPAAPVVTPPKAEAAKAVSKQRSATKEKTDAVQKPKPKARVPRGQRPEVGLRQVGEGDAQGKEAAGKGRVEGTGAQGTQEEVAAKVEKSGILSKTEKLLDRMYTAELSDLTGAKVRTIARAAQTEGVVTADELNEIDRISRELDPQDALDELRSYVLSTYESAKAAVKPKGKGKTSAQEVVKAKAATNTARLLKLLGPQLYGDLTNMQTVAVKEMFQNAFDGIKDAFKNGKITKGEITITLNENERTIRIEDNGNGMSPETVQKAFLTIAGTEKQNDRQSGGLGIAKAQFLFANEGIDLLTVRDGVSTELTSTGEQLSQSMETGDVELLVRRNSKLRDGTDITIKVPKSYTDPTTGEERAIPFDWWPENFESVTESPLFENIEVKWKNIGHAIGNDAAPIGANFPLDKFIPLALVKFQWGDVRILVSKDENNRKYSKPVRVLSNGLFQFRRSLKKNPFDMFGEELPRTVFLNVEPSVKPDQPGYPFALNRQDFSPTVKGDMDKVLQYLALLYRGADTRATAESFGNFYVIGPNALRSVKLQLAAPENVPTFIIDPGAKIEVNEGRVYVNGKMLPELTKDAIAALSIDRSNVMAVAGSVPDQPLLHDNTARDTGDSLVDMFHREFGAKFRHFINTLGGMMRAVGETIVEAEQQAATQIGTPKPPKTRTTLDTDYRFGISFDKEYRGVHIKVPFEGIFINPAANEFTTPQQRAFHDLTTIVHEVVHDVVWDHNADFIGQLQRSLMLFMTHPRSARILKDLTNLYTDNAAMLARMSEVFHESSTRNRGESLKGSDEQAGVDRGRGSERNVAAGEGVQRGGGRPEDGGTGLARVRDDKGGAGQTRGNLSLDQVADAVAEMLKGWKNPPRVEVVKAVSDLPVHLRNLVADNDAPGVYDPVSQTVWIVSDHAVNGRDIWLTTAHEVVGHHGLRSVLGAEYEPTMRRIFATNKTVREAAQKQPRFKENLPIAVEEVLAAQAETEEGQTPTFVDKVIRVIRAALRKVGFKLDGVTDGDIRYLLADARKYVMEGTGGKVGAPRTGAVTRARALDQSIDTLHNRLLDASTKGRGMKLGAMMLSQITDVYKGVLNSLPAFYDAVSKMAARNNALAQRHAKAHQLWQEITGWRKKDISDGIDMLFLDSTLAEAYADLPIDDPKNAHLTTDEQKAEHARLAAHYQALVKQDPRVAELYRTLYTLTAQDWQYKLAAMESMANAAMAKRAAELRARGDNDAADALIKDVDETKKQWLSEMRRLKGPYFPISRFGDFVVVASSPALQKLDAQIEELAKTTTAEGQMSDTEKALLKTIDEKRKLLDRKLRVWGKERMRTAREELVALRREAKDLAKKRRAVPEYVANRTKLAELRAQRREMELSGRHHSVSYHESMADAQAEADRLRQDGLVVPPNFPREKKEREWEFTGMSRQLYEKINDIVEVSVGKESAKNAKQALFRMYVESIGEQTAMRHMLRRRKRQGFKYNEALRMYSAYAARTAHHIAVLENNAEVTDALLKTVDEGMNAPNNAETGASQVANEVSTRYDRMLQSDHTPIQDTLTQFNFLWLLGLSPAFMLTNLTQGPLVAVPAMGGRFGNGRANRAFWSGMNLARKVMVEQIKRHGLLGKLDFDSLESLSDEEKQLFNHLLTMGRIDITIEQDIGATARGSNRIVNKLTDLASLPAHWSEVINRISTGAAAYYLAKDTGGSVFDKNAAKYAEEIIVQTQLDYSKYNAPRFLLPGGTFGGVRKVLFQFRKYQIGMVGLLAHAAYLSVKGEDAKVKREARNRLIGLLGYNFAAAGAMGFPLMAPAMLIAKIVQSVFGDDDEPVDPETALRNFVADMVGPDVARVLMKGLPTLIGADLSARVGYGDILSPVRTFQSNKEWAKWYDEVIVGAMGPTAGVTRRMFDGMDLWKQGNASQAMERWLPKVVSDTLKAYRYATEGTSTRKGNVVMRPLGGEFGGAGATGGWAGGDAPAVTGEDVFWQGLGIAPIDVAESGEARGAVESARTARDAAHDRIVDKWIKARRRGDQAGMSDAMAAAEEFSRKYPQQRITGATMMRAWQSAQKYQREVTAAGVRVTKKDRALEPLTRFAQ